MARALCRDCLTDQDHVDTRCPACGSPRLIVHPERDQLGLAHVDCDAFYATIEKRDDPALTHRPVIIGGGRRGVVATACYVARIHGVRSAMPMFRALALCPDAVVIKPDMAKYAAVGHEVRRLMRELTPLVEPVSIDEAFLDLSGTEALHKRPAVASLAALARRIEREVGITVSVGLSHAKFLAKIASDLQKPRGFSLIGRAETVSFLADRPVSLLPGVGAVTARQLETLGCRRIGDLNSIAPDTLQRTIGSEAKRLTDLARGTDPRPVTPEHDTRSVSSETTFGDDIADLAELEAILWRLSERTAQRLRSKGLAGKIVTLKLKTSDFRLLTRARQLAEPTQLARRLFEAARPALRAQADGRRFRLLGVGVTDLSGASHADRGDLGNPDSQRDVAVERAVERLRQRFGEGAVQTGRVWRAGSGAEPTSDVRSRSGVRSTPTSRRRPASEDPA